MQKVIELYRHVKNTLAGAGIEEADAEARLIVADGLDMTLGEIFLKGDIKTAYDPGRILEKRIAGMPLAYAMQKKYFMGFPFYVDESVLIPRQDTEILADEALSLIREKGYGSALDLCCGSGCVGIAVERISGIRVLGSDISEEAVYVANKNAKLLGTENYRAIVSDLFQNIDSKWDMIVCNPPYVTEDEYDALDKQVRDCEPRLALVGNLYFYEKIAADAAAYLNRGGALAFEIGCSQRNDVWAILQKNNFENIRCRRDLAGRHRVMVCTIN
jgi:release factor glutamine methyltransferase